MQELRFVAVSEDVSYAVLAVRGRSARFTLPIDERLRAVALGQTSRLAQYEIEVESPLRPKEIQARIRAGETAEEIADAAGIPVERMLLVTYALSGMLCAIGGIFYAARQNSTDSQKPLSGACAKVQGQGTAQLQLSNQSPTICQLGMSPIRALRSDAMLETIAGLLALSEYVRGNCTPARRIPIGRRA